MMRTTRTGQCHPTPRLRGLVKFIKSNPVTTIPCLDPSTQDEDESLKMICAMSINGSIHPEAATGLKGVTDPAEMVHLFEQRFTSIG